MSISPLASGRNCFLQIIHTLCLLQFLFLLFGIVSWALRGRFDGDIPFRIEFQNLTLSEHCRVVGLSVSSPSTLRWSFYNDVLCKALIFGYVSECHLVLCFFNKTIVLSFLPRFHLSVLRSLVMPAGSDMCYIPRGGFYIQSESHCLLPQCLCHYYTNMPCRQVSIVDHGFDIWADHYFSLLITCRDLPPLWKLTSIDESARSLLS